MRGGDTTGEDECAPTPPYARRAVDLRANDFAAANGCLFVDQLGRNYRVVFIIRVVRVMGRTNLGIVRSISC